MSVVASLPLLTEAAPGQLPDAIAHVERGEGRVVLTRDGKPVAAVVPIADLRTLEEDDAEDAHWSRVADERLRSGGRRGERLASPMKNCLPATG